MGADKPKKGLQKSLENADEDEKISYFQIFRFGKWYEVAATMSGILFGLLSCFGVCYNLAQFGELSTSLVERTAYQEQLSSKMPLLSIFGGGRRLHNASHEENMRALMEDGAAMGIGMAISVAVSIILCTVSVALINWSAMRQISRIRSLFLQSVLRQDMSWYDTDTTFNLASRMSDDMLKLKEGMSEKLAVVSNLLGTAIVCFLQAFPMGWELALACCTVVPFSVASSAILTNYQTLSSKRELDSYSQAGKVAEEVLKAIRTVVAFGGEEREVSRYQRYLEPAEKYGRKRGLYTGLGTGFNWVLTYSLNAIGLAYGARLVLNDLDKPTDDRSYNVGEIFSILFSVYMGTQSITFCIPHGEAFSASRAAALGIFKLIDRTPAIDSLSSAGSSPKRISGSITLENVCFSYPSRNDVLILNNFSIHIKAGESVALVGSSGCGKSTILQLIQRLYDPESGVVKVDGKDLKTLNLGWLRSSLDNIRDGHDELLSLQGVVGQEPVLFRGTILENIAIADPDAKRDDIHRVAKMAYAHDFIVRLPDGYDTVIGERGASLSGGQKQRIAIARSLLREPVVLLLDEATSALDPHSERQVQAALDRAVAGRTTLTVSHRLSTIVNCDRIVCMDQGAIVEEGTYEELMKRKNFFYKLVTTNHDIKDPDVIETLTEEDHVDNGDFPSPVSESELARNEVKRRSTRRVHRVHSVHKRNSIDFMPPRGSISSVNSISLLYGSDKQLETKDDEEIKPVSWMELLKLNAPEWKLISIGSIAAFVQGACFPAFSVLFGHTLGIFSLHDHDEIIQNSILYSVLFLVVAAIAGVTMCLQSATFTSAGLIMTTRLRLQYFSSLLRQEMGYHDRESNTVGAQCARLSGDASEVQGATGLQIGLVLQGVSSVFIGFVMGVSYNWKLTLVGTVFLPLMVGSIWLEGIISQKSAEHERSSMEAATSIATEAVVSIRTVQSLGVERVFMSKFEEAVGAGTVMVAKKSRWRGLVLGMGIYVPFLLYVCATVYGVSLIAYEGESYEVVLLVTQAIMYGAYMLGQSLVYAPNFNSAKACGARIIATINRVSKIQTEDTAQDKKDWVASGEFAFKDIEFSYPTRPHQKVIKGISLKLNPGQTVAFVGASGCGKSTMLQLMQRFYDPDSGTIELDGHDIRQMLTLPQLRQQLGVVQQEPVLLERSLAENIAYGDNSRKVSMQEVVEAARAANIHSFIVSLPKGYESRVGGGTQLSGGQKQRVCIARALVRAPRLLLLDEATSALDASSERQVAEALLAAAKGRTCATIAHRLSTVRHADLICVLDKGRIVEKGTHEELIALQGHYWKLSKGQQLG